MSDETQIPDQPSVSIGDIMAVKQILEVATSRGAFRASELTQVGTVYDRISAWIDTVVPAQEVSEESTEESTDEQQPGEADA